MMLSAVSTAAAYDDALDRSPSTGVTPRNLTRSAFSGSRTSAVTSWPPRRHASSTADPMYPVAPVRKIRIAEAFIVIGPPPVPTEDDTGRVLRLGEMPNFLKTRDNRS